MSDKPSSDSPSDQANTWFARLQADDVSDEERRRFQDWFRAHPEHAEAYEKTRKLWSLLQMPAERVHQRLQAENSSIETSDSEIRIQSKATSRNDLSRQAVRAEHSRSMIGLARWKAGFSRPSFDKLRTNGKILKTRNREVICNHILRQSRAYGHLPPHSGRNLRWVSLTCLSLLLMVAGWHLPEQLQNWRSDYHTAAGQQLSFELEDGSRLTLNTDTALAVRYSDSLRKIELLRGEAYFEVAPNKNRPFVVDGGQATARAVGTAYGVRRQANDLRVVVNEGTVEVAADSAKTLVHAAEQAEYRQGRLQAAAKLDNDDALAWRRKQTVFHRQPLMQVLEEVNRYRKGRIVAINPKLAERVVNGVFNNSDPDAVVAALTTTLQAKALRMPGDLVLLY